MNAVQQFDSAAALRAHYARVQKRLSIPREQPVRIRVASYAPAPLPVKPIVPTKRWQVVIGEVAAKHGVRPSDITGPSRQRAFVMARHEVCYRMHHELSMSFARIGRCIGDRDHTTILNSIRRHAALLESMGEAA